MENRIFILSLVALLCAMSQTATAQFYQRKDSTARVLRQGVSLKRDASPTVRLSEKKKPVTGKKKKSSHAAKKKRVVAKKDTTALRKKKNKIVYSGAKYKLGDRVIMRGDSGADVRSLANILVKRLFLDENDIIFTADGGALYEGAIIKAVRTFQKVAGLYEDGVVATTTLKALRKRK